ncbi:MAG: hypothetical protein ACO2ZK_14055, partial [Gemmobacter sp.]
MAQARAPHSALRAGAGGQHATDAEAHGPAGEPAVRAVAAVLLSVVRLVRGDLTSASAVCDEATVMLDLLDR